MQTRLTKFIEKKSHPILLLLIIGSLLLGFINRFIQDDAFISFRYAKNLVDGHGLAWNIGDPNPVEGYTNFLWVLLIAIGEYFNFEIISWSMMLSMLFGLGTLLFTYQLCLTVLDSKLLGLLAVFLLGTNFTFSSYLTGGLETQLQTFLIVISSYFTFLLIKKKSFDKKSALALSVLFSLCILTRIDSILFCLPLFIALIWRCWKSDQTTSDKTIFSSLLSLPGILVLASWILFKWNYYGDILPNTFYVKASGHFALMTILRGLVYNARFIISYGLILFLVILLVTPNIRKALWQNLPLKICIVLIASWVVYMIKVGGGFMEFRFFVPILPFIFLVVTKMIVFLKQNQLRFALVISLIFFSMHHAVFYDTSYGIESTRDLNALIKSKNHAWQEIGMVLGELFGNPNHQVKIAVTAAGAIPYYSSLKSIDMLGLNDKWIARNGLPLGSRPGHTKIASIDYLIQQDVNLLIGHPRMRNQSFSPLIDTNLIDRYMLKKQSPSSLLFNLEKQPKLISIPINENFVLDVIYLIPNNFIDSVIKENKLKTYHLPIESSKNLNDIHQLWLLIEQNQRSC